MPFQLWLNGEGVPALTMYPQAVKQEQPGGIRANNHRPVPGGAQNHHALRLIFRWCQPVVDVAENLSGTSGAVTERGMNIERIMSGVMPFQ